LTESLRGEQIRVCYAESLDGLHWVKPALGICDFKGSRENNIILDDKTAPFYDNFCVFKDENPACQPDKKYKAIGDYLHTLTCFYSADGVHFKVGHLITDKGSYRKTLNPGEEPHVTFHLNGEKAVAVYAYCNLHGLWKTELGG
jgi:hypothetical protein